MILVADGPGTPCEIDLRLLSMDLAADRSTFQVMAWCRQATSHYLRQYWPRSLSPYGVTGSCLTTAIWRCRKPFSQWQCSFQRKLRSHWVKFLRQRRVAIVKQRPDPQRISEKKCTVWMSFTSPRDIIQSMSPFYRLHSGYDSHYASPTGGHGANHPLMALVNSTRQSFSGLEGNGYYPQ